MWWRLAVIIEDQIVGRVNWKLPTSGAVDTVFLQVSDSVPVGGYQACAGVACVLSGGRGPQPMARL